MMQHLANFFDAIGALGEVWVGGMWRACWQGGLAVALAWALSRALGERFPARLRPWPWRLALLKMLLCLLIPAPLALRVLPPAARAPSIAQSGAASQPEARASSPGVQNGRTASRAAASQSSNFTPSASAQASTGAQAASASAASTSEPPNEALAPSIASAERDSMAAASAQAAGSRAEATRSPDASSSSASARAQVLAARARAEVEEAGVSLWPSALLVAWLGGVGWSLARLAREGALAARWRRGCSPLLDESAQGVLGEMCARLKVRHAPLLLRSGRGGPLLLGILKPAIVLPEEMLEHGARGEMKLALAHEAAHLKRRDLLWNVLLCGASVVFWFHPALWLARGEWRLAAEQACDELALGATRMPVASYGALLLQVAVRRPAPIAGWASLGVADDYALLRRRIAALAGAGRSSKRAVRLGATVLGASAVGIVPWQIAAREAASEAPASTSTLAARADVAVPDTSTPAAIRASAQMPPALAPTNEKAEVTVLSPSGQPVAGARVLWAQLEEDNQQHTQAFTSDARGRFLFPIGRVRRGEDFVH